MTRAAVLSTGVSPLAPEDLAHHHTGSCPTLLLTGPDTPSDPVAPITPDPEVRAPCPPTPCPVQAVTLVAPVTRLRTITSRPENPFRRSSWTFT